ncbi:addiction module toxin, RelE/StbE family [Rippkaea orientalis PCC 8801]|uniref:Addiction module toxin, RelE/StbE family n=1 Tax=Rippkaea orientalis (strain PCC 8801 / RF-1) TaxID=41431 RepID=B7JXJ0_RIPO1|nr:type II toxin-antitoxin system mRNA interferase toxin, RelE/StbE family [Rippkaea orientalis]ACK64747.1 addiction module toxin, RelE/StbE family [Rippkaea orientalis PCC 8801]
MKLVADRSFKRAFKRLVKKDNQLHDKILRILDILEENPFTTSLKSHKLTGNLEGYWSCSVSYDCRIIFTFSQDNESKETLIVLVDIGSHDEVY